jgi:preprotein translocase subunit SecB
MTCTPQKIQIKWGNPYVRDLAFTSNEVPINLTDYNILWAMKRDINVTNDTTAVANGTCVVDADQVTNTGKAVFSLTELQTKRTFGTYYIDFKVYDDNDVLIGNTTMFNIEIVPVSTMGDLPQ